MTADRPLLEAAAAALEKAYAPFSGFRVGAALKTDSGEVFTGCNIENSSFGLTVCAERTALFKAVSAGHQTFECLAVVADAETPPVPCGACRQVLAEFCGPELIIQCAALARPESVRIFTLGELLPEAFRLPESH